MPRYWALALGLAGVLAVSAVMVRPGRWSAGRLAGAVGRQLATGDAAPLVGESTATLRLVLTPAHVRAATLPLRGAHLARVRLASVGDGVAVAHLTYVGGQTANLRLTSADGGRWHVAALR